MIEFEDAADVAPPKSEQLAEVSELASDALEAEAEVVRLSRELKAARNRWLDLVSVRLPDAMNAVGMNDFTLKDSNYKVVVREAYVGTQLTNEEGLAWVEENDGADAIKTEITIELPKGELDTAREVLDYVKRHPAANRFLKAKLERYVHQATIGAFVKQCVEAGKDAPLDLLGVHRRKMAQIGGSRTKSFDIKGLDYK